MMPAAKHGDPQLGVDVHLCVVPPSPSPVPLPTPHMSIVFDPFDYVPFFGATVTVCGMKRATAGTNAQVVHIPPGFPFAPKMPDTDDELFMGSATVVADGDPFSFISVPVLSCQVAGMLSPFRPKKKGPPKAMVLPTTFNLAIPTSVFVGGPPTISLMGMAFKGLFAGLGRLGKTKFAQGLFDKFKDWRKAKWGHLPGGFLKCKIFRAEPVNIVTGEVSVEQEDFTLPGRIPIEWVRRYRSNNRRMGACGAGWETPADTRLEIDPDTGFVLFSRPGKDLALFPGLPQSTGDDGAVLELWDGAVLRDHGEELRVRTKEDRIYHFPKRLSFLNTESVDEYPIARIADLFGNWLEFERWAGGLVAIQESAGRRIEIEVKDGLIRALTLHDPASGSRHRSVEYQYDAAGDLTAVLDALGNPYRFAYDQHHLIRHTDRNGLSFYYDFDTSEETWRVVHSWGDGGLYDYRFHHSKELNETRLTDSLGHVWIVKFDEHGLPLSEIDPLGGMTSYQYDEVGRTTAVIDPDGHRTEYEYDERGNLTKLTRPDGHSIASAFDARNKAVSITDPNGAVWQQEWDGRGLLARQTSPLGAVSRYKYDDYGQLVSFTNPRGARTGLGFGVVGNLSTLTDALGHRTQFAYDLLGNVTGKRDPLGRTTCYRYDAKSRLTDLQLPSGATIRCGYDAEDNLVRYVDENGAETRLEYAGLGEIKRRLQPDGYTVEYHYDAEERLIGVTNQRGELYQLNRDPLGRIVEEVDYWGQPRRYKYSACGYIERSVDPLGRAIAYATDPLGRILKKTLPDPGGGETPFGESFAYDPNGNLVACANPHIRIERRFDAEGRMVEEKQGSHFVIRNTFDEVGNRIRRETELGLNGTNIGHTVSYAYDPLDQAVGIAIDHHPPIRIERDAAGQIVAEQLSPMLRRETEYSADGYLTRQRVSAHTETVVDVAYNYDRAGNLTERRDAEFGTDRYTYDPVGHITQHLDPQGKLKQYFNDAAGDRLRMRIVERGLPAAVVGEAKAADRERSREGKYEAAFYRFDRAGNLIYRRDEAGDLTLRWDADQRLIESRWDGVSTTYNYDTIGRRIRKYATLHSTSFAWDGDRIVGESLINTDSSVVNTSGVNVWVHYPETFEPFAVQHIDTVSARGQQGLFYVNDPNGCPIYLINTVGEVIWRCTYSAWGDHVRREGDFLNAVRLQAQYYDEETRLAYNRHRYYEPSSGQFISADPIGIAGGINTYQYAPNINVWVDPLGLACHFALWEHRSISGLLKALGEKWSGGSGLSRRLSWREQLATHTEVKILKEIEDAKNIAKGDVITIVGHKPPCNPGGRGCQSAMEDFAQRYEVILEYLDLGSNKWYRYPK